MRVTTADFIKHYGTLADRALAEPVTITKNGRDRLVSGSLYPSHLVYRSVIEALRQGRLGAGIEVFTQHVGHRDAK